MILELQNIGVKFKSGDSFINVLNDVNFSINKGESVSLVGPSGTGKSTLLQVSALLEKPTSGEVVVHGKRTSDLSDDERTKIRRENIGFVYQFHNLLPEFSALENVMIPSLINNTPREIAKQKALDLLDKVDMSHRANHNSKTLSGGEQQRIAIARALANDPDIIIADEPTGNLDPTNAEIIFNLFLSLVKNNGASLFMATHNIEFAKRLDRLVAISNGTINN
ncbi:MAG: ABC transporter ATP-binding protein [Holosporales bacterium]|jgi:lipoprotein-releasing system ATP-binding protein|nr:ABC transporter ATP-binding protein [Holosporales bacterium]